MSNKNIKLPLPQNEIVFYSSGELAKETTTEEFSVVQG